MPSKNTIKTFTENTIYHVYNRGVEKRIIFLKDGDKKKFLELLSAVVCDCKLNLFAYCLMKNHFHLFFQTQTANLSKSMQKLQGLYVQYLNRSYDRVGPLFQGRFQSKLVDKDTYSAALIRYIHLNPVEDRQVASAEEYPWSSYRSYYNKSESPCPVDTEWFLNQLSAEPDTAIKLFKVIHSLDQKGSDPGV